jgi:hypothetical protein
LGQDSTRALALACAAVLFMGDLPKFVEVPLRLAYSTVAAIPLNVIEQLEDAGTPPATKPADEAFAPEAPVSPASVPGSQVTTSQWVARTMRLLFAGLLAELKQFQTTLPFVSLAFFLITWFVLGQVLGLLIPGKGEEQTESARALSRLIRSVGLTRTMLILLLAAGLTLCVAAIIAVSELRDTADPDNPVPDGKTLAERLKASEDPFGKEVYPFPREDNDPVELLRADLQKAPAGEESPEQQAFREQTSVRLSYVLGARAKLDSIWKNLVSGAQGRYERATQDAQTEYEVANSSSHGAREQRHHFLDIIQWHNRSRLKLRTAVESCRQKILTAEAQWVTWATEVRLARTSPVMSGKANEPMLPGQRLDEVQAACQLVPLDVAPKRMEVGDALGPLKSIAGWLLQTESVQLALIIGMLGAGLLGSAVATFLRNQGQKAATEAQLAGVVVRGVAAAIVVFLAAQGGLSTLSSDAPRPNPHVLLLICFVAAVYSEQVWEAALKRLVKQLGDRPAGKTDSSGELAEETGSAAPAGEPAKAPVPASAPPATPPAT